jgi:hypothetical protein
MKNSEEAIGKVLEGLREADAPVGMERRILVAVEARASRRQVSTPRWTWGVAFAGMVVVCLVLAITAIHRHEHPSTQAQQRALPAESARDTQVASLLPNETHGATRMPARSNVPMRKVRQISADDALLLREMRAPSHLAPEAPLTQEEKLLLRVVHTGDSQLMAMLDPEERARQEAESKAEFQKFVEQSGKKDHESNQITEYKGGIR